MKSENSVVENISDVSCESSSVITKVMPNLKLWLIVIKKMKNQLNQ